MMFTIEVLPKGRQHPVVEELSYPADPSVWTDLDAREVLQLMLLAFDRVSHPEGHEERAVTLRGLDWIVTPHGGGGAVIAIEIASGAVAAGPFAIDASRLDALIRRALAPSPRGDRRVH